jgi:hypothetical protein
MDADDFEKRGTFIWAALDARSSISDILNVPAPSGASSTLTGEGLGSLASLFLLHETGPWLEASQ